MPSLFGAAAALLLSCAGAPNEAVSTFEPGASNDAVVRAALVESSTATLQVTINNSTSYALSSGLVTFDQLIGVGASASPALTAYLRTGTAATGNAATLASELGLVIGLNAFVVPEIAANGTITVMVSAPAGSKLSYLARETIADPDFVASYSSMSYPNGASGTFLTGFALNPAGKISRGNSSVSPTPNIAAILSDVLQNCGSAGNMAKPATLFTDTFAVGPNSSKWPMNAGYDGDFNGDWYTDGTTARVWNPVGGNPEAPLPVTTGFYKFLNVCPTDGATISISATIDAAFTSLSSSATLVLYYFDANGALIRVDANHKIGRGNVRRTTISDSPVPLATRRIAIAPMAYLAIDEQNTLFFSKLQVTYAPKNTFQVSAVSTDTFANYVSNSSGANQPAGWTEFGGDYFVLAGGPWVTLWNSTWGGDQSKLPPIDTGLVKRFTLPSFQAGDVIDARIFAAATFSDPSSFVRVRLVFNSASSAVISAQESDRLAQSSYANVEISQGAIPAGSATVDVIVNAYLGPTETSSFYAKNLVVNLKRQLLK